MVRISDVGTIAKPKAWKRRGEKSASLLKITRIVLYNFVFFYRAQE